MPIDGIEGTDFVDKQFSSEEIRLVRRLPKNLQDRALKCLKEQKIIYESDRSIESDSHTKSEQEKRSKSKSNGPFRLSVRHTTPRIACPE